MNNKTFLAVTCCYFLFVNNVFSRNTSMPSLQKLSLEELMNIDITIATKKEKKLSSVAAPVFVISADDIRHSGANNVPEALRMVPGMQVSQVGPHDWSVTIRGFNSQFANKLLVLVDGRTIYSGLTSGTYWRDIQSMAMENIARIEVIRGPGGTIWGANAVNGVINIITRSALESEGGTIVAGGGTEQRALGRFSYSKKITEQSSVKTYANYFKVDDAQGLNGQNNQDGGEGWRTGIRFDFDDSIDKINVDGSWREHYLQYNIAHTLLTPPFEEIRNSRRNFRGGYLLAKWSHQVSDDNQWTVQTFYDYTKINDSNFQDDVNVWDIELSHQFKWMEQHTIIWGAGYRHVLDNANNSLTLSLLPTQDKRDTYNIYAQDEIALDKEKNWLFTLGSKFEYYSLSRWEVQPSVSLLWHFNDQHRFWGSISHAVRTPSRNQNDVQLLSFQKLDPSSGKPVFFSGSGKKGLDAENMTAYQLGWRGQLDENLTTDVTFFYHNYDDITRIESTGEFLVNNEEIIIPSQINNNLYAQSYGAEIVINWQPMDGWRNYFSYSYFKLNVRPYPGHRLFSNDADEQTAPQQLFSLRSNFKLSEAVDLDFWFRYTDQTKVEGRAINSYFDMDLHLGWRVINDIELSVVGQNLIQGNHLEFNSGFFYPVPSKIERGVYGKLIWHF